MIISQALCFSACGFKRRFCVTLGVWGMTTWGSGEERNRILYSVDIKHTHKVKAKVIRLALIWMTQRPYRQALSAKMLKL